MISRKKRILIVDDDVGLTRVLKLNLEATNRYSVQVENASREALHAARQFKPDLILLDVMMPQLDGGDLAALLRSKPDLEDTPIVFLTAAAKREELEQRDGTAGGLPFMAKPAELDEVIACIEKHARV